MNDPPQAVLYYRQPCCVLHLSLHISGCLCLLLLLSVVLAFALVFCPLPFCLHTLELLGVWLLGRLNLGLSLLSIAFLLGIDCFRDSFLPALRGWSRLIVLLCLALFGSTGALGHGHQLVLDRAPRVSS